jgi:hypothetical protein
VYVVGDNFKLVPRSSTRNFTAASDAAMSADVLPFDSSHLRASNKKDKSSSSSSQVFSASLSESTPACEAPPPSVISALLHEIQKLDISLYVTHHTSHVAIFIIFFSYGLDLIRDETDGRL